MFSKRVSAVAPFEVMQILARAQELERRGEKVVHLEIGEPDFPTPERIVGAASLAMRRGCTHYTDSRGTEELRRAIAEHVRKFSGRKINPRSEILVTGGVSLALLYALAALLNEGDEVLLTDPTYPCYQNFIRFLGAKTRFVALDEKNDFSLDIQALKKKITQRTKAILLNSPSNPTGMLIEADELEYIAEIANERDIFLICDEIYSGLVYDRKRSPSVLSTRCENAVMLDGFSKLYAMTGWRLGYAIARQELIDEMLKLQQNFYISPSAFAQEAALQALRSGREVRRMLKEFDRRRRYIVARLREIQGFDVFEPKGAYYVFPSVKEITSDSTKLANFLLEKAHVAVTPGAAFGKRGERHLRFSYANSIENLEEGLDRVERAVRNFR